MKSDVQSAALNQKKAAAGPAVPAEPDPANLYEPRTYSTRQLLVMAVKFAAVAAVFFAVIAISELHLLAN
ncbi:hypothetical protein [Oleidesulfovibrio sp.]|uniref:hypothetical protein n=1 Tax=Oleidesulfovibrio sp. TaxID=2909707 RepID=UPI003A8544CF